MNHITENLSLEQQRAYKWAKEQNYQSVASQYAKALAEAIDSLVAQLESKLDPQRIYMSEISGKEAAEAVYASVSGNVCVSSSCPDAPISELLERAMRLSPSYIEMSELSVDELSEMSAATASYPSLNK